MTNTQASKLSDKYKIMGLSDTHVVAFNQGVFLHPSVLEPWSKLQNEAQKEGFDLVVASGFRSFGRQLSIWNQKLSGKRRVCDERGQAIVITDLEPLAKVEALMQWSAVPGTSRHHWGTDMDIFDRSAIGDNYRLQLLPAEYEGDGPFAPMLIWLQDYLQTASAPDFFFPYRYYQGGIMPEPWHLSYRPTARQCSQNWHLSDWQQHLANVEIEEQETLLQNSDYLYRRFIKASIEA